MQGSQWIPSIWTAFFKNSFKDDLPIQIWLEFWKLLIPAGSVSFLLCVTGALHLYTFWQNDKAHVLC